MTSIAEQQKVWRYVDLLNSSDRVLLIVVFRVGDWLPQDQHILREWLQDTIQASDSKRDQELHPSVYALWQAIESDARLYMLFNSMFDELPAKKPYRNDPDGYHQIRDCHHMC